MLLLLADNADTNYLDANVVKIFNNEFVYISDWSLLLAGSIDNRPSSTQHDMYNKLWGKEREDIQDNYQHIDTSFAKENMENSLYYDVVGVKDSQWYFQA